MYTSLDFNKLLEDYFDTADGKAFLKENKLSIGGYDEAEMEKIAQELRDEIIKTFLSITSHASLVDAQDYFSRVSVSHPRHLKNGEKVAITFSEHSLRRPSLVGRNGKPTGNGIEDIFALITNGTSKQARLFGYWTYYSKGMGYGAEEGWTRAWLPRRAKPFIKDIISKYEARYPNLKINYPPEWN